MPSNKSQKISTFLQTHLLKDYTFLQDYLILDLEPPHLNHNPNHNHNHSHDQKQESSNSNDHEVFIGQILGTEQLVKFHKVLVGESLIGRFQAMVELYNNGVMLVDNLFVLEEAGKFYFYIIQAYIPEDQPKAQPFISFKKTLPTSPSPSRSNSRSRSPSRPHTLSNNISQLSLISPSNRFTTLSHLLSNPTYIQTSLDYKIKLIDRIKILLECVHQTGQAYVNFTPEQIVIDLEDQDCVYLAPFQLKVDMGWGQAKRAYLAPEILEIQGKERKNGEVRIGVEKMMIADIWAFGCIMLEILFYCNPVFYAVNTANQLKQIDRFINGDKKVNESLKNCIDKLLSHDQNANNGLSNPNRKTSSELNKITILTNLLLNTLQPNPSNRILTSQRSSPSPPPSTSIPSSTSQSSQALPIPYPSPLQLSSTTTIPITTTTMPLSLQNTDGQYDSQLHLFFVNVGNLEIRREMRINVYLDRKYCVFVSSEDAVTRDGDKSFYKIQKSIRVKNKLQNFYLMLSQPILVQLVEATKTHQIHINLSTLILQSQGKRIWPKPIIGSYSTRNTVTEFPDHSPILKIKSQIITNTESITFGIEKLRKEIYDVKEKIRDRRGKDGEGIGGKIVKDGDEKKDDKDDKDDKENRGENLGRKEEMRKVFEPLQPVNHFESINKSLQQICQKWKSKDSQNHPQSSQLPPTIPQPKTAYHENDTKIDKKIRQMLAKLQIV